MTPIEIFALIVAVIAIVKVVVLLVNPKSWMKFAKAIYAQPAASMIVSLLLAAVVLYYLLTELTIVQIFAAVLFTMLLALSSFSAFPKELLEMANKLLEDKSIMKKAWLPTIVWVALIVWVLYALVA